MGTKGDEMRKHAENCSEMAQTSKLPDKASFLRMAEAWRNLAQTEDWLDGKKYTRRTLEGGISELAEQCERMSQQHPHEAKLYVAQADIWRRLASARLDGTTENHFGRKGI